MTITLHGVVESLIATAIWAALVFLTIRLRQRSKTQEKAANETLENYKVVAGVASAMQNSGLMIYLQTQVHMISRLTRDLMFILLLQLLCLFRAEPSSNASALSVAAFLVALASTLYTGWNLFWSERALDRLESAILTGLGAGVIVDLQKTGLAKPGTKP